MGLADDIAVAIVAACELFNENPIAVAEGAPSPHARSIAFWALQRVLGPRHSQLMILRSVGYVLNGLPVALRHVEAHDFVDEVVGAVLIARGDRRRRLINQMIISDDVVLFSRGGK